MHIFIDESGNFVIPRDATSKVSSVTSLIIADEQLDKVLTDFCFLKKSWGEDGEIKGSQLTEKQISDTIALLRSHDVIVEISWLNVGHHATEKVDEYKIVQADKLVENVTKETHGKLAKDLENYRQIMKGTSNQLFLQAMLTIDHILDVITFSTIYYSQRLPKELGDFVWIIDAKNSSTGTTSFEDLWSTLILPFSEANFTFKSLDGGDYSFFDEKYSVADEDISEWRRSRMSKGAAGGINAKKLLKEHLSFQDSKSLLGLQLVDIMSSAFTRAMNNTLKPKGWRHLGYLMLSRPKPRLFMLEGTENKPVEERHLAICKALESNLKPILLDKTYV